MTSTVILFFLTTWKLVLLLKWFFFFFLSWRILAYIYSYYYYCKWIILHILFRKKSQAHEIKVSIMLSMYANISMWWLVIILLFFWVIFMTTCYFEFNNLFYKKNKIIPTRNKFGKSCLYTINRKLYMWKIYIILN